MINEKLYRETFSRLRASDEAKKEVLMKMNEQTKTRRLPKILRAAAIAAMLTVALAVTANAATNGELFENLRIVFQDDYNLILEDDAGNIVSVTGVHADAELQDGRLVLTVGDNETDITDAIEQDGVYSTTVTTDGNTAVDIKVSGTLEDWEIDTSCQENGITYNSAAEAGTEGEPYISVFEYDGTILTD